MEKKYRILLTLPFFVITTAIFILSSESKLPLALDTFIMEDKVAHFIAYLCLGISIILAIVANFPKLSLGKLIILTLIIGSFYGFTDELHQSYVPGRDASVFDWTADVVGTSISLFLYILLNKRIKNYLFIKLKHKINYE